MRLPGTNPRMPLALSLMPFELDMLARRHNLHFIRFTLLCIPLSVMFIVIAFRMNDLDASAVGLALDDSLRSMYQYRIIRTIGNVGLDGALILVLLSNCLIVPLLAANAFTNDRSDGVLPLLRLTAVTPRDLVALKTLPPFAIACLLGLGIDPLVIWPVALLGDTSFAFVTFTVWNACLAAIASAAGVLAAARIRSDGAATLTVVFGMCVLLAVATRFIVPDIEFGYIDANLQSARDSLPLCVLATAVLVTAILLTTEAVLRDQPSERAAAIRVASRTRRRHSKTHERNPIAPLVSAIYRGAWGSVPYEGWIRVFEALFLSGLALVPGGGLPTALLLAFYLCLPIPRSLLQEGRFDDLAVTPHSDRALGQSVVWANYRRNAPHMVGIVLAVMAAATFAPYFDLSPNQEIIAAAFIAPLTIPMLLMSQAIGVLNAVTPSASGHRMAKAVAIATVLLHILAIYAALIGIIHQFDDFAWSLRKLEQLAPLELAWRWCALQLCAWCIAPFVIRWAYTQIGRAIRDTGNVLRSRPLESTSKEKVA